MMDITPNVFDWFCIDFAHGMYIEQWEMVILQIDQNVTRTFREESVLITVKYITSRPWTSLDKNQERYKLSNFADGILYFSFI